MFTKRCKVKATGQVRFCPRCGRAVKKGKNVSIPLRWLSPAAKYSRLNNTCIRGF